MADSKLNILNYCSELFDRYKYFLILHYKISKKLKNIPPGRRIDFRNLQRQKWMALSVIDSFFSWTEHIFIHLAVIARGISDGNKVTSLITADWDVKFKQAIPLQSSEVKKMFDQLVILKKQVRNFVTHGAFRKNMEAFQFHSEAGAVPVRINYEKHRNFFSISGATYFDETKALILIDQFIQFLWSGELAPGMEYAQKSNLPTILPMASDGSYVNAMISMDAMKELIWNLNVEFDRAGDMDW